MVQLLVYLNRKKAANLFHINFITMIYKKHPEYNLIIEGLFNVLDKLNTSHPKRLELFKEDVLSKRNNPKEYIKALIHFLQDD